MEYSNMLHKRFDTGHQDVRYAVNSMLITHLERFTTFFKYKMSDYIATPFTLSAFSCSSLFCNRYILLQCGCLTLFGRTLCHL